MSPDHSRAKMHSLGRKMTGQTEETRISVTTGVCMFYLCFGSRRTVCGTGAFLESGNGGEVSRDEIEKRREGLGSDYEFFEIFDARNFKMPVSCRLLRWHG